MSEQTLMQGTTVHWAPLGADPNDPTAWKLIGVLDDATFEAPLPTGQEPAEWSPGDRSVTIEVKCRITWRFYRLMLRRTHPAARRAKAEYRRRRR
ncbi:hypothetical protein ACQP10_38425 (plasmid) [Streptosporangium sandarakinum]|uniref:hypothetical protein n=1 Tax=Streptosporangium sandarakinum TaxID=1260955 RepID=UPI003D8F0732